MTPQTAELTRDTLRRLAELHVEDARVLSVYLSLEPSVFAMPAARSSEIRSLIDEADRRAREANGGLSHQGRMALRGDVERVREFLERADFSGAHGLAVFASEPADLFEVVRLPRAVQTDVMIDESPYVEPLADFGAEERWCVFLASRKDARIFRGSPETLVEVGRLRDDVHSEHDEGGWSQANYQRSVDNEAARHLRRGAKELFRRFENSAFDHLLVGAPEETFAMLEPELHPYLRERLRGRLEVDVENTNAEQVLDAARPLMEEHRRARQAELVERLREGVGRGDRAAAGLADVVKALNERRVEALLLDERFSAPGAECMRCGWLSPDPDISQCPADGTVLQQRDEVKEQCVERALTQDAELVVVRDDSALHEFDGIGAVLRF